ncbi:MAG: XdhC/CoxI family protein [Thermomicrobium sp.]|nr:XdhC/CoxI family protein [Thermomicrobium sp.]
MTDEVLTALRRALHEEEAVVSATLVRGDPLGAKLLLFEDGRRLGSLGASELDDVVASDAVPFLQRGGAETRTYRLQDGREVEVFLEAHLPPRHLVVVGAVHIAIPLVAMAKELGYRTTVIDAREFFATKERFPHADQLIVAWPDEALAQIRITPQTDIVILAHDEKFEDPALHVALRSRAGYIGAIGSRKTSQQRLERLRRAGFSDEELTRLHAPIGLDIGAKTPAEIAVSILAEIIAVRRGRSGQPLRPAKTFASTEASDLH